MTNMGRAVQIGTAAKTTGLSIDTIRYYQKAGLLKPPARTSAGYRVFTETEISDLQFIARAQNLGFSLAEIKELVSLRNGSGPICPEVRELIQRKLLSVREKIHALQGMETELERARRSCDRALRNRDVVQRSCPVIERIATGKGRREL